MKQLQLITLILTLIASLNSHAQTSLTNDRMALVNQVLSSMKNQRANPKAYQRINAILTQEVNAEIQTEANAHNMNREEYLSNKASYQLFAARLRDMRLSNMSQNDLVVALIKASIRHNLQVEADNSLMSDDMVLAFHQSVLNRLGVVLPVDVD